MHIPTICKLITLKDRTGHANVIISLPYDADASRPHINNDFV